MGTGKKDFDRDEPTTLIPCLACGGAFRRIVELRGGVYKTERCRWCVDGAMSAAQVAAWRRRTRTGEGGGEDGDPPPTAA